MTHFDADAALRLIEREHATVVYPSFPAIAQALLNHPDYHRDTFKDVRVALNVAPADTLRDMQARMPHTVMISSYGLTEAGGVVCFNDLEDTLEQRCTTGGTPFEGMEAEIRDLETGEPVEPGRRGEIVVRGYGVFEGYHKDPERTADVLDADGWLHTGDVGAMDAGGRVSYLGRTKDMLKVGGENVAAVEIESYIATHPAVSIVAVVGVPDPKYMEVAAAFIELRPGSDATEEDILEHCRRGLARFKVPRYIRFITDWPMSATKIQKFRLQERMGRELAERRAGTAAT
jgi:fatty-acyl-CoA synthase